jgi:protein-S-isoprenylcysteine O-methyltransferase Ste14
VSETADQDPSPPPPEGPQGEAAESETTPPDASETSPAPTEEAPKPGGSLQGLLPTILTVLAVVALGFLSYRQLSAWPTPARWLGIAMIVLYVGWLLGEGKVMAGEAGQKKTERDKGTYELYALGRAVTLFTALGLENVYGPVNGLLPLGIGLGLLVLGVGFRWWAIRTLGRFYSHFVRKQEGHQIVDTGPYRFLRHPAYTGMLIANLGFVLCFFNWIALGALLGFFLPAVARRILVEEQTLFQIEGYPEFAEKRWRLFPPIW